MTDVVKPQYKSLITTMRKVISAHVAVAEGIATHAQKEQDRRQAAYHKAETERALKPPTE